MKYIIYSLLAILLVHSSCDKKTSFDTKQTEKIAPILKTTAVPHDSDDPAFWFNEESPEGSLILGTDKEIGGGLMVFDVQGRLVDSLSIYDMHYPNNVDIEQGVHVSDTVEVDIAVVTEREKNRIRVYSLPDMKALDNGGIPVFLDDNPEHRRPMGVALFKDSLGNCSAIVSRKEGPKTAYLEQWALNFDSNQNVEPVLMRRFGNFSGKGEIEAIMVDDKYGYIYYSDESYGIRKYHANPREGSEEILVFGKDHFAEDREGIALWPHSDSSGVIIVSNQQDLSFNVYDRNEPHDLITNWKLSTIETDGCEVFPSYLNPTFPHGVFIAMSEDKTFHLYDLQKLPLKSMTENSKK